MRVEGEEQELRTKPWGMAQLGGTLIHKWQLLIVSKKSSFPKLNLPLQSLDLLSKPFLY